MQHPQGRLQRPVDVCAPAGIDALDEPQGRLARFLVESLQFGPKRLNLAVVGHDVEQIAFAEVVQNKLGRAASLFDLLAAHAARAIHHEDDRLLRTLPLGGLDLGAGQQQKIAVLVVLGSIAQHARADLPLAHVVQQTEVGRGNLVLGRIGDRGVTVVGPFDLNRVRGAIDVLDVDLALDGHADLDLFDRMAGILGRAQRKEEVGQPLLLTTHLRVAKRDGPLGPGRDGKHARLEQARTHPLQQRRVLVLADDRFVQTPGLVGPQELGRVLLAVDQQGHPLHGPVVRQRKHERHLELPAARVHERLRNLHLSHLIDQPGLDGKLLDLVGCRRRCPSRAMDHDRTRQTDVLVAGFDHQQPLAASDGRNCERENCQKQSNC